MSDESGITPYVLAATLILMRETADGPPELLMLERASSMAFGAGALVFPGGRVDAGDWALADRLLAQYSGERDEMAQRIAAIRETIEEAGIAIGLDPPPDPAMLDSIRERALQGRGFGELLDEYGLRLDPGALTAFARWRPIGDVVRRFDTRFFLAAVPADVVETVDGGESVRAVWATARALLDDAKAGHHRIMFPTWCNLDRLDQFGSLDEAKADSALYAHHLAAGRVEQRDGVDWLCVDEGIGYPNPARLLDESERN